MPYEKFDLPKYPCTVDMWDELKTERRPIVIYGMGNGADKLIERFSALGIKYADIFASDGFVRGHSFHGIRVKSFSEIRDLYENFVIVLSFASNRKEVLDMLADVDGKYDMYVPDMPVAGTGEYFDRKFYNSNYDKILRAYETLCDRESKSIYSAVVNFKLSGRMKYLEGAYSETSEIYSLMHASNIRVAVDAGAYNGDTVREMKSFIPSLRKVYAIEPDKKNFRKLARYCEAEDGISIVPINAGAWSEDCAGELFESGNRNSTVSATASYESRVESAKLIKIDSVTNEKVDYIKYDVEGAEREALLGSRSVISRDYPTLLVSVYHRSRDLFEILNVMSDEYPGYRFYMRKTRCLPAWEINLIMIPKIL